MEDAVSTLRPMRSDCRALSVIDGDTLRLYCPGAGVVRARVVGYDTPELFSPDCEAERQAALAARDHLATLLQRGDAFALDGVSLEAALLGRDRYERSLVDLRIGGERVATRMVRDGHGRRYLGGLRGGWCRGSG